MTNGYMKASSYLQAVLWDLDGTLIDSEPLWQQVTAELSAAMGRRLSPEKLALTQGATIRFSIETCAEHAGVQLTESLYRRFRQEMFDQMKLLLADAPIIAGIPEVLASIQAAGIDNYVVTNTFRELADPALSALGKQFFRGSICGDEVVLGKPDPEIYRQAAFTLGYAPGQCLVFEDSTAGMTAAVQAGCKTIAVPGAHTNRPVGVWEFPAASFVGLGVAEIQHWFAAMEE